MALPKKIKVPTEKVKTLFDHFSHLLSSQSPDYFSTLTEGDRKTWSNWMINKLLSMIPEYIETTNELQRYSINLEPELYYKVLISIIPKKRIYSKYIKKTKTSLYSVDVIEFLAKYFLVSTREIEEYLDFISEDIIIAIYKEHGFDDKEIKKLLK